MKFRFTAELIEDNSEFIVTIDDEDLDESLGNWTLSDAKDFAIDYAHESGATDFAVHWKIERIE